MIDRVLVVGGAGYIGGRLTDQLQDYGHDVTVFDILAYEERFLKQVPFVYGDIRDREKLLDLLPQFDTVVWLAAIVGDGACAADPFLTQSINADCVKWLVDNYDGRIVFTSTCSVYGANNDLIDEDAQPNPLSIYAKTKLEAEQYILENAADRSLMFRLGTLYGIGDEHSRIRLDLVVNILAKRAACGEKLCVFGGDQWRPLIHVQDVADAIMYGIEHDCKGLYNLSIGNYRIRDIAEMIQKVMPEAEIDFVDMPFEDQRNYRVKTDRWYETSWRSDCTLEDGIREIVQVIQEDRIKNPGAPIYSNELYIENQYRRWL